ncbi:hypothetical protein IEQ34_008670 [Dendrobium chrysotoxum]|uniref:Uncharacterized protein n=1 Tax=Dendrobium chrysotoxum TaxID=161865 RepID=A0AAV7GYD2_DENCH|nr:hypothetical protein IEQ34_008670 [Dendrobium chrysotoxum]
MEPLTSISSLKKLSIEDNDELVSFPNEAEQHSLSELEFRWLKSLQSLPSSLESLSSLQYLYIEDVPMLRKLPNLPPSLNIESRLEAKCDTLADIFTMDEIESSSISKISGARLPERVKLIIEEIEREEALLLEDLYSMDRKFAEHLNVIDQILEVLIKFIMDLKLQHQHEFDELRKTWLCKRCQTMNAKLRLLQLLIGYLVEATEEASIAYNKAFLIISSYEVTRLREYQGVDPYFDSIARQNNDIVKKLISAGLRYLKDQVRWKKRTKEELEKLKEILPQIQAVVHFASSQEQITDQNPDLNKWLWQLRHAIDDADDVLDELEYMELEKQVTKNKKLRRVRSIMKSMKKRLVKICKRALKIDPTLKRLEEAVQKLYRVSTNVASFLYLVKDAKQEQQLELYRARETGSSPKNDLIGRGKEKELVMEWLRNPSNEPRGTDLYRNISLLSIVGHGGMGKTTLLQHVYKDEITKEFDLKMWVCVSNNFDVKKVIADMLESLKKKRPPLEALAALHDSLEEEVKSKKFLLLLDDIWEEDGQKDGSKWENVLAPLACGGFGSKILVTTRTDSIALMFAKVIKKKKEIVKLEGLEEDACLQLLNSHAFAGVENRPDDHKKLRAIAGEIVKKLLGSALAAKVIGCVLNSLDLDERRWRTVLESNLLGQNSVHSILTLSYIVLSNPLKSCFAFCGMFAQDHNFDKDDLIRMWIALGFIQPYLDVDLCCENKGKQKECATSAGAEFSEPTLDQEGTMEDIGGRYFDVLVKKSFFEKFEYDIYFPRNSPYYKMHDLLYELTQSVFIHEYLRVEDSIKLPSKIPKTLRHLSVQTTNPDITKKIGKFKYLRSLFLFYGASNQDICSALIEIFKTSRSLRLLYIWAPKDFEIIPEEFANLIHLRYLEIGANNLTMLPRSLSNLYHLQYIINYSPWGLGQLRGGDFLPSDINNLSNLRYVKLRENCISSIRGIGKLNSLQELDMFGLRDVSGINCLENVKDAEEARNAQLCEKRRLTDLTLYWSDTYSMKCSSVDLDVNVLDNLLPPECLMNLSIKGYIGARSPVWMNNVNPISNLEKIELTFCCEWETLPPLGQLRFLKSLKLSNMPKVKRLESNCNGNDKYRALEVLHISYLEALEDWFEAGVAAEDGCLFPCLIELVLENCPKLKELPSLPSKLKSLQIDGIGWTALNFCSNSNTIPLESLWVHHCPNITSLPLADEIARLAALRYLEIRDCPNLISLGRYREVEATNNCHLMLRDLRISDPLVLLMEPLRSIASLKELRIVGNDELISFPNEAEQWFLKVRPSLSELRLFSLKSLQSLPSSLESLDSLQELYINDVPKLRELPNLPPSLESLTIWGECHQELHERYREDGGSDRHKIARIPHIYHEFDKDDLIRMWIAFGFIQPSHIQGETKEDIGGM